MRSFLEFLRESRFPGKLVFKTRKGRTDFGHVIYFDAKQGRFALYWYDDDLSKIYLSNVDIWKDYQGIGLGEHSPVQGNRRSQEAFSAAWLQDHSSELQERLLCLFLVLEKWL